MQADLFSTGAPQFDASFAGLRRWVLSASAWVDWVPEWLTGHQRVFEALEAETEWHAQKRMMYDRVVAVPRLLGSPKASGSMTPLLNQMAELLSAKYAKALTSVTMAFYRDAQDSVAMHSDKLGPLVADSVVAIVAVGSPRRFLLRPKSGVAHRLSENGRITLHVGRGDLLVMGGSCQRDFDHGVPKTQRAGARISIMFREAVPASKLTQERSAAVANR